MKTVAEIADLLNQRAPSLAPELLPNGHLAGDKWMASGIADTGKSASLYLHLKGPKIGHWADLGNCPADEQHGDMLDLLRLRRGLADAAAAVGEAKKILGIVDRWTPAERARAADTAELEKRAAETREAALEREKAAEAERALKIKRAKALFLSGVTVADTPAEQYLWNRGLTAEPINGSEGSWPGALRYHPQVWHAVERVKCGCLLGAIYNAGGEHIGVQRIYLGRDRHRHWGKLDTPNPKMVLGTLWGGFVPINKGSSRKPMAAMPEGEPVYVTEGIEDALAVRMLRPKARIIAAVTLGNIGAIILPPAAKRLVIVADRDVSQSAQDNLERAIGRQQARGLHVGLVMPPEGIKDLNDWLREWREHREKDSGGTA